MQKTFHTAFAFFAVSHNNCYERLQFSISLENCDKFSHTSQEALRHYCLFHSLKGMKCGGNQCTLKCTVENRY